ncbi:MAG: FmdB family transcriptional regulator [Chloroflexi bacterium]|nr:FmdB family transcriptional regulator [Chloroflexota bacterium]
MYRNGLECWIQVTYLVWGVCVVPLYEYLCRPCDKRFERRLPIATRNLEVDCPECGENAVKTFSVFASQSKRALVPNTSNCCGGGCGCG